LEVWRLVAIIGVFLFASTLIQPLASMSFLGMKVSINLIDLYTAVGRIVSSKNFNILLHQGSANPNMAVKATADEIVALLITLIFYPATVTAGLAAAAKNRKLLITAGSLGLVWWAAASYIIASFRLSFGQSMLQFGPAFTTSFVGTAIMIIAYFVPSKQS